MCGVLLPLCRWLACHNARKASTSVPGTSVPGTDRHAEVVLHAGVPCVVVGSVQIHPFFIGHRLTPAEKREGIGADGVAELPGSGLDDLADFLRNQGGLSWLFE